MASDPHHTRTSSGALPMSLRQLFDKSYAGMVSRDWANNYVGIPFRDNGCGFDGCNCWGLVKIVLWNECGILVPEYGEISAEDLMRAARQIKQDSNARPWIRVQEPREFDVVLMTAKEGGHRICGHAGIMTSATRVLHVWKETAAVNMGISHARVRETIVGFYRHEALSP